MIQNFEIDWGRRGQSRPHQDSVYEATLRIFEDGEVQTRSDDYVKNIAKTLIHPFHENPEWHQPRLTKFTSHGNCWEIQITQPYLD